MSLSDTSKTLISIKKLVGKAHTSNDKDVANEGLPTGLTVSLNTVFGQTVPVHTGSTTQYEIIKNTSGESIAEFIRLSASFIAGSDTSDGRHGFELKLPDDYVSNSQNPNAGTYPFLNQQSINITSGSLQLIPPSFDSSYEAKPYHTSGGQTQIPVLDARDWSLDYFNGVFFQQDPPGTGDHAENPKYVDAYLYVGKFADRGVFSTGLSGSLTRLTDGTSYLVAGDSVTIQTGSKGQIVISSTDTQSQTFFSSPTDGNIVTTGSLSFAGGNGANHTSAQVGSDTFFFVSGSTGAKDTSVRGATVFGGDVVISGTLHGGSPLKIDGGAEITGTFEIKPKTGDTAIVRNPSGPVKIFANTNLKLGTGAGVIDLLDLNDGAAGQIVLTGSGPTAARSVEINSPGTIFLTGSSGGIHCKGTVVASSGITGSLTRLSSGKSYLAAGSQIQIVTSSAGQVSISSVSQAQRKKMIYEVTASHSTLSELPISGFNISNIDYDPNRIDLFVNGQLVNSGTSKDYLVAENNTSVKFYFDLFSGDIITIRTY